MAGRRRRRPNLKRSLFLLPNLITLSSVFCGLYAIVVASRAETQASLDRAALLIVFALFFDMLDGRVARLTKTESAFGLQIDSLADVVSFGVAPALLAYRASLERLGWIGVAVAFCFLACGAIRLARFNVLSTDQSGAPAKPGKYIVGLPIPGAAGILVSLVVATQGMARLLGPRNHLGTMVGATLVLAALMVSTMRFRSFKDIRLTLPTVLAVALIVGSSVLISTQLEPAFVLVWLLGGYVLLGIGEWAWSLLARLRRAARGQRSPVPPTDVE
jgi:CDP-diacylglycerol--serine O-phosphatidyltransferase